MARAVEELRVGRFRVCFSQGINARLLDEEAAAALASWRYYDGEFRRRRIYTAWDNRRRNPVIRRAKRAREARCKAVRNSGVHAHRVWPGETHPGPRYRRRKLREFGCLPYPMPYVRTPELVGFQRWVVRRADLRMSWDEYSRAHFRPERIVRESGHPLFEILA